MTVRAGAACPICAHNVERIFSIAGTYGNSGGSKFRLTIFSATGNAWFEFVVALNFRFTFDRIPFSRISRSTVDRLH